MKKQKVIIVVADDDEDDRMMTKEAFEECKLLNDIYFVSDGIELLDFLHHRGKFSGLEKHVKPGFILLDLNMPRMDGREALRIIKSDEKFKSIPISIFTTSKAHEDVLRSYNLGVNCFITKPVTYTRLVDSVRLLGNFWLELVELPK